MSLLLLTSFFCLLRASSFTFGSLAPVVARGYVTIVDPNILLLDEQPRRTFVSNRVRLVTPTQHCKII